MTIVGAEFTEAAAPHRGGESDQPHRGLGLAQVGERTGQVPQAVGEIERRHAVPGGADAQLVVGHRERPLTQPAVGVAAHVERLAQAPPVLPFERAGGATGWNAPSPAPWFERALNDASNAHFGAPCGTIGQGGTIPLMNMLSQGFPKAQMMVCGVLGPKSNAHGPNEFLHVPYAKRLTAAVASVIAAHP